MAFLRSVTRCNSSLVSRKRLPTAPTSSSAQFRGSNFNDLSSKAELLSCNHCFVDFRREFNTRNKNLVNNSNSSNVASSSSTAPMSTTAPTDYTGQRDPLDVSFNDPIAAFKSKTTWQLVRAYVVFVMCSSETLVDNNQKVKIGHQAFLSHWLNV